MADIESDSDSTSAASGAPLSMPISTRHESESDDERFLMEHADASPGSECGDEFDPAAGSSSSSCYEIPLRRTNLPALTGSILAAGTTGGITYAFSLYASALKHTLDLTESELDTISSASFCAGLLSWIPGMAADKFGPRRGLAAGGVTAALSLVAFWSVARQYVSVPRPALVPILSALNVGSFLSSALVTGSVFKIIVASSGPGSRGSAVGAAKGYVGLGAGAYACMFEAFRGKTPSGAGGGGGGGGDGMSDLNFLPMAASLCVLVATVPALCLVPPFSGMVDSDTRRKKPVDAATPWHFRVVFAGLMGLGGVVVGSSIMELYCDHKDSSKTLDDGGKLRGDNEIGLGRAALIFGMWILPILAMLCLPRKGIKTAGNDSEAGLEEERRQESLAGSLLEETRNGRGLPDVAQRFQRSKRQGSGARYVQVCTDGEASGLDRVGFGDSDEFVDEESGADDEEEQSADMGEEESASVGSVIATGVELNQMTEGIDDDDNAERNEHRICEGAGDRHDRFRPRPSAGRAIPPGAASSDPHPLGELPLSEMLRTYPAWLLLWTCTILCGGGTVMTNNIGQMAEALRLDPDTSPAAVALFSAAQAAGRVCTGSISESALNWRRRVPRPAFLIVASVFGFVSHVVLAFASTEVWFVAGVAMTGWAFGMIWPLMVLIVGETFGTRNVGANYMFYDGFTSAAGTLLLSKFVAQEVYESHIHREHSIPGEDVGKEWRVGEEDGLTCYGMGCFQLSHIAVAGLSLSCVCSSAAFMHKTREVYERRQP